MDGALHAKLLRLAARRVGWADAEDVVQTAYLQVWQHREYGPDRLQNPRLLARVVRNVARDELRRRRSRPTTVPLRPWHGGLSDVESDAVTRIEAQSALAATWASCARGWPAPVTLLLALGWTERELAERLGLSLGTVKTARLRERLRVQKVCASCSGNVRAGAMGGANAHTPTETGVFP